MKILAVCSTLNFRNFPRRATIEAIWRKHPDLDILLYSGIKSILKRKSVIEGPQFLQYHSLLPENARKYKYLNHIDYIVRKKRWRRIFRNYDVIFFTDPNQHYLLPYVGNQKIVYLIRDPNVLQSKKNYLYEKALIEKADLILATSQNLAEKYLPKYHKTTHPNIKYWPNCVDLDIWNVNKIEQNRTNGNIRIIGMAGNINDRTDLELLAYMTKKTDYSFQLCGRIFLQDCEKKKLDLILERGNVEHLGYIPFNQLQQVVSKWDVGITIEGFNKYTRYTHHNKVYQYLALGIPVVTLKIHNDYEHLHPYIQAVDSYSEYVSALEVAMDESKDRQFRKKCIEKAEENSAERRAEDILIWVEQL